MNKKKILVVEDNEVNLRTLEATLIKAGYSVICCKDGAESIDVAKKELPDMILLDFNLPGKKGFEVGEILKNYPETRDIPICFITGLLDKEDEVKLKHNLLGNFFFSKPHNTKDLLAEIEKRI